MGLKDYLAWYQQKILKYDQQKWETTIEHKILYGLRNIQMKNTTPNRDFIDLDMIRGSTFTKNKPKQGFMATAQWAAIRTFFLPFCATWWKQQISLSVFLVLCSIYIGLALNVVLYYNYGTAIEGNTTFMEILVPFSMLWILTLIHTQISVTKTAATSSSRGPSKKRKFRRQNRKKPTSTTMCQKLDDGFESLTNTGGGSDDPDPDETTAVMTMSHFLKKNRLRSSDHNTDNDDEEDPTNFCPQWNANSADGNSSESSDVHIEQGDNFDDDDDDDYDNDYDEYFRTNNNSGSGKVTCFIWKNDEVKKADLSMVDISSAIIGKVVAMSSQTMDYFHIGLGVATVLAFIPVTFRICHMDFNSLPDGQYSIFDLTRAIIIDRWPQRSLGTVLEAAFGAQFWERFINVTACMQRWLLAALFFFLLAVAENTFKQRFLCAKLFTHLTTYGRAHQSKLPHFRLNKVQNIKTWLAVRSYLQQRGPQRAIDVIVSTAFIITLMLLAFLCIEILKESGALNSQYHVEALIWCLGLGVLLLRFMTLGSRINKKYRNLSILITEQINLHLQIEQKPHKKDELTLANNVLKLAIDLIKELQSNFKISGLSANSILYNVTKLIILSALSGVLSEILGFKLKLHKIKIK